MTDVYQFHEDGSVFHMDIAEYLQDDSENVFVYLIDLESWSYISRFADETADLEPHEVPEAHRAYVLLLT